MTRSNSQIVFGLGTAFSTLATMLAVGCGDEFQDCTASRTCKSNTGGAAGNAGTAGNVGGGGRGGSAGELGTGGTAAAVQGGEGGESGGSGGSGPAAGGRGGSTVAPIDAGAAGEAGSGGDGNALPATCERDSDCGDRNACNGVERCEANECVPGAPVECESEEPEHCAASCETVDGEAVCGHVGADADEDGYKSAACSLSPGNDCNDDDAAVHPGAAEMCDGEDSDCDSAADAEEEEVVVAGKVDVLVARDDASQTVLSASIAGFGEKATANPNSLFAVAWTHEFDECKQWQTNRLANDASMTRIAGSTGCYTGAFHTIDVVARPAVLTVVADQPLTARTHYLDNGTARGIGGFSLNPHRALSFQGSEYRLVYAGPKDGVNGIRLLGHSRDLEQIRDEAIDDSGGEYIDFDGANGSAIWTLRVSPTLDRVYTQVGDGVTAVSNASTSASHPRMAWSEDNGYALAWRYATGEMRFKHLRDACEVGVGDGFPGELTATPKGYVLISLSENKREVVAKLLGPACKLGPQTVLARVDEDGEELEEPKIGVTAGYLRAIWKRVTSEGTALESRQFRWDECE